jgi:hypothetical protein
MTRRLPLIVATARFLGDIVLSAAIACALSAVLWGAIGMVGIAGVFIVGMTPLITLIPIVIFAPFAIVAVYGLAKRRFGFAIGPAVLGLAAYLVSVAALAAERAEIAALAPPALEQPHKEHDIIAIDGGRMSGCDEACINAIALAGRTIARSNEHAARPRWTVFRPATGDICSATHNAVLSIEFLKQGHVGKCAAQEKMAELPDALVFRSRYVDSYHPARDLPDRYRGEVYELFEREQGRERLLARRLIGALEPSLPSFLLVFGKRPGKIDMGPAIDVTALLAEIAKRPADKMYKRVHPFPFDAALDEIEKYFGRKEIVGNGQTRSVEDFAMHYSWGIFINESGPHSPELKRRIARLLASDERARISTGLMGLYSVPLDQSAFADDRLFELVFAPLSDDTEDRLFQVWQRRAKRLNAVTSPISDRLREAAKSRLEDAGLTDKKRKILTIISGEQT